MRRIFLPLQFVSCRDLAERLAQLFAGLALYGVALALLVHAHLGVAPWDVLSLGLARHLPLTYGGATIALSVVVLLLWIPLRQRVGIGTLANGLTVGLFADAALWLLPDAEGLWMQVLYFALGLVLLAVATAIYIAADFGPGPRDGLMTGLLRVTGWRIWVVRTMLEGSVLGIGWLLGGPVGVGTLVFAFGIGPLIGWFMPPLARARAARAARNAARGAGRGEQ